MKHFQLFEQFVYESKLDDNKKELQVLDDKMKSEQAEVDKAQAEVDKEQAEFDKWNEGYEKRKEGYDGNYYLDTREEYKKAYSKLDNLELDLSTARRKFEQTEFTRERLAKEIKKQEQKSANKGASGEDAAISKIRQFEDDIESSVDYDFDAYPSSQIKKIMAGGDEAKEIIKKYNDKINDVKSELGDITNAMADAKEDGDKEQLIELKLELELRKAEAELYAAIIKADPKGLVTPLKKIQKINQKMDQSGSSDD